MRADRLVAALLVLQRRGTVTAAELAAELEVSERTARRDLEALAVAGVPVYPRRGRGGGWALLGGARTDLSGLTAHEARALFLVAGPAATATPAVRAGLRKLVRALPEPLRDEAEAASKAIRVDPATWGRAAPANPPPALDALQRAVVAGERIRLAYADRAGSPNERTVDPYGLVAKGSRWYLVAGTAHGRRTFRVDRVRTVTPTGEPAPRPDGFDLDAVWAEVVAEVEARRTPARVVVRVEAGIVGVLRGLLGARARVLADVDGPGWARLELAGTSPELVAAEVAGFGARIEVLEPLEARRQLARIGAQLLERYGGDVVGRVRA